MQALIEVAPKKRLGEALVEGEWITHSVLSSALSEQQETNERLGEILVRLGFLSSMELKAVLASQADMESVSCEGVRQRLGDLLLKSKRINENQLGRALSVQRETNEKLGEVLVRFGLITSIELGAVLAWQNDCSNSAPHAVKLLLGEILVATDVISRGQLHDALKQQKLNSRQIGDILVETGYVKPHQISDALKIQSKLVAAALVAMLSVSALTGCGSAIPNVPIDDSRYGSQPRIEDVASSALPTPPRGTTTTQTTAGYSTTSLRSGVSLLSNGSTFAMLNKYPYVKQGADNTCAQASMTMVMAYWGTADIGDMQASYQNTVNENNRHNLPTNEETVHRYLTVKGLAVQDYKAGNVNFIKSLIDQGRAPIVLLDFGQMAEHYVVVVGYDLNRPLNNGEKGVVYLHDSIDGPYTKMALSEFQSRWKNSSISGVPVVGGDKYNGLIFDVSK